jgi:hypothetical protein
MATWQDVERFIRSNYTVLPDAPKGMIALSFSIPGGRSQMVFVSSGGNETIGSVVHISSVIGQLTSAKVADACREASEMVVGGIVQMGDHTVLRHSVLLENLDENELVNPLLAVTLAADNLEKKLTGRDRA